jgi:hypothetical protein
MIVYTKKFIRFAEAWGDEKLSATNLDIARFFQCRSPINGSLCREFHTILLDLSPDADRLLGGMKRVTRYEVRRAAAKDNFIFEFVDSRERDSLGRFVAFYDRFAQQKAQPPANRSWLSLMSTAGSLRLSLISDPNGDELVWHAYHYGPGRATLLHSASLFRASGDSAERNRIARANRYQHWRDMLQLKEENISIYDFGGWYFGEENTERLRINSFKEMFGGRVVKNYICETPLTAKGKLFLYIRTKLLGDAI